MRRKQLLTMAPIKVTMKMLSQQQKEQRDTNKYQRRRLAWCSQTGQQFDASKEQYSILPRSLAEVDGSPHNGTIDMVICIPCMISTVYLLTIWCRWYEYRVIRANGLKNSMLDCQYVSFHYCT